MLGIMYKRWRASFLVVLLLGTIAAIFLWDFNMFLEKQLEQEIRSYVDDIREQSIFSLNENMVNLKEKIKTEARIFESHGVMTEQEILEELITFAQDEDIYRATIVTPDGIVYSSEFGKRRIDPEPYLDAFKRTEIHISRPRIYEETGQQFIDISTVLMVGGEKLGSLSISYDRVNLEQVFKIAFLDGDCSLTLVTGDGTIIGRSNEEADPRDFGENIFDFYSQEEVSFLEGSSSGFKKAIEEKRDSQFRYKIDGKEYFVSHAPTGINDWHIATSVADGAIRRQAGSLEAQAGLMVAKIAIIMLTAILLFVAYYIRKRKMLEQLKDSYRLALRRSNDLFYEIDLENDTYVDHSEQKNTLFAKAKAEKYSTFVKRYSELCSPESRQDFLKFFLPEYLKQMQWEEITPSSLEYKVTSPQKIDYWFESVMIPVLEDTHKIQRVICVQNDVTLQKRKVEKLRKAARLDGLTMLYNKVASRELIEEFLTEEGMDGNHALFMVDIDSFKEVNDRFGHLKGDEVIVEFGKLLARVFRKSDVVGRNGGDEFIVFLKECTNPSAAAAKAEEVNACARSIRFSGVEEGDWQISVSIGIALFREDGETFEELYQNADTALYLSKNTGRDKFSFFDRKEIGAN